MMQKQGSTTILSIIKDPRTEYTLKKRFNAIVIKENAAKTTMKRS